jgi:hypothetical protein
VGVAGGVVGGDHDFGVGEFGVDFEGLEEFGPGGEGFGLLAEEVVVDGAFLGELDFGAVSAHEVADEEAELLAAIVVDCAADAPDEAEDEDAFHLRLEVVDILLRHFLDFGVLVGLDEAVE